jgi:hypothetical protein
VVILCGVSLSHDPGCRNIACGGVVWETLKVRDLVELRDRHSRLGITIDKQDSWGVIVACDDDYARAEG